MNKIVPIILVAALILVVCLSSCVNKSQSVIRFSCEGMDEFVEVKRAYTNHLGTQVEFKDGSTSEYSIGVKCLVVRGSR